MLPLILADIPSGLAQALAQEGVPCRPWRLGMPEGRFVLFDSRRSSPPRTAAGQVAIDIDFLREGLDYDPLDALLDQGCQRAVWRIGPFNTTEEIARLDKRSLRRQLLGRLRKKIQELNGIWLRISAYPFPYQSAFNFRIDYDEYDALDFARTVRAISGQEHATSHFVCGASYESAGKALDQLRGLDVGSHGYRHHTYRTFDENVENVRRGIDVLRRAGIEPSGFVAPHGRFNRQLVSALESLKVSHSSEFGFAYDELPYFVGEGDLLQIPVHPVSLGILFEAAQESSCDDPAPEQAAVRAVTEHFLAFAQAQYRMGEPVFLYGHPTRRLGRHPEVLQCVLPEVARFATMWKTTLSEFAAWWRYRSAVRLTVTRQSGRFTVTTQQDRSSWRIGIEYLRGEHVALVPLDGREIRFSPATLGYHKRTADSSFQPVRVDQPEGIRDRVRRLVDWELVTPMDEIRTNNLRNWAKKTLRRLLSA
jgi:peptidoglycan/xylan/chitin deacetylase (PgdA/CDA1 family)